MDAHPQLVVVVAVNVNYVFTDLLHALQEAGLGSEEVAGLLTALFEPTPLRAEALRKLASS